MICFYNIWAVMGVYGEWKVDEMDGCMDGMDGWMDMEMDMDMSVCVYVCLCDICARECSDNSFGVFVCVSVR